MKSASFKPLLFLTLGWFGIEMAMALDATQFQILLDQALDKAHLTEWGIALGKWHWTIGKASLIALVLSLGPLAGITIQPFMGWLGDKLLTRGISRRFVMKQAVFYALVCTVLFALKLSLWALIVAIALFFISFNALNVNYRALVTETSNRKALSPHKGTVSGLVALFSGLGGFCMFMLFGLYGNSPWPAVYAAGILLVTTLLVFRFAPGPKIRTIIRTILPGKPPTTTPVGANPIETAQTVSVERAQTVSGEIESPQADTAQTGTAPRQHLGSLWHWLFYAIPVVSLIPAIEKRLTVQSEQRPIFRLFLVVFFAWLGIQALRAFFVLLATKDLHVTYSQANIALAVLTLVMVAAALPLGKLADRMDNRKLLLYSLGGFALICAIAYGTVHSFASVILMSIWLGASFAGMIVLPLSLLFKLCPQKSEGTYSGLYNLFMSVPQLYSLFLTGWLVDMCHSYRVILLVGAVSVALAVLLTLRLPRTGATGNGGGIALH
jgi:MFS family permease